MDVRREWFAARLQRERAALLRRLADAPSVNGSLATLRELHTPQAPYDRSRAAPTDGRVRQALEEIDAALARLATRSSPAWRAPSRRS
jgi:hypothetical protein